MSVLLLRTHFFFQTSSRFISSVKHEIISSGITGNGFVIHATLRVQVFRVDRSTVTFIRHLAITDLLYIILNIPPLILFILTLTPEPGLIETSPKIQEAVDKACYVFGNAHDAMVHCNVIFILVISINRFLRCMKPLQISVMSSRQEAWCLVGFWGMALAPSITKICLQSASILPAYRFESEIAKCQFSLTGTWETYNLVSVCTAFSLITLCNLGLLILSLNRESRLLTKRMRRMKLQAFLITGGISCIFIVSWLPAVVVSVLSWLQITPPMPLKYATHLYIVNTFSNPILYAFVNTGYFKFLQFKVKFMKLKIHTKLIGLMLQLKGATESHSQADA